MKFSPNKEDVEALPVKIGDKKFIKINVIKEDENIEDKHRNIFYDLAEETLSFDKDGEHTVTNTHTKDSAQAIVEEMRNIPEYAYEPLIAMQAKSARTARDLKKEKESKENWRLGSYASWIVAGMFGVAGLVGAAQKWNEGYDLGEKNILAQADGWGSANFTAGMDAKEFQIKQGLEERINAFDQDDRDAAEYMLFGYDVKVPSIELSTDQCVEEINYLVEQKALENTDVAGALKNATYDLILTNTTYDGSLEDLQAMNLSHLEAVAMYGELKMKDVIISEDRYDLGKKHGAQDVWNQTDEMNATHYSTGIEDGKILGSQDLYNQAVDFVTWILDQEDVVAAESNITKLLELYTDEFDDYIYSLTKWTADYTLDVANQNLTAAEEGLERTAGLGPAYTVTIDNATKYKSWYANMTEADAAEIENVTGASVDEWYNHGNNFELVNTFGDDAVLSIYENDSKQMFKVSQDLYNRMDVWETAYEGE